MTSSPTWSQNFHIHSYEIDPAGRVTLEALCRYFQEAAWNHAESLGAGYSQLRDQNKLWVLSRFAMEIEAYPKWGAELRLETWPRPVRSVFAWRDFEMFDRQGARFAAGASAWLVLDAQQRKPLRVDKLLTHIPALSSRRALTADPEEIPFPAAEQGPVESVSYQVRWSDLDVNTHANYSSYIRWIFDAQPIDWLQKHEPRSLQVNYLGETGAGQRLTVQTVEPAAGCRLHQLRTELGAPLCRARTDWRIRIVG